MDFKWVFFFLALVVLSIVFNSPLINLTELESFSSFFVDFSFSIFYVRFFIFIVFAALFFSTFAFVNFPPGFIFKSLFSIVLTFLVTLLIPVEDYAFFLIGFSSLGVAISLFVPILILSFVSYSLAINLGGWGGYFLQRILWLFYSFYLFIKTLLLGRGIVGPIIVGRLDFLPDWILTLMVGPRASVAMFVLHFFIFIFVFYTFFWKNKEIIEALERQKESFKFDKYQQELKQAEQKRKIWAES